MYYSAFYLVRDGGLKGEKIHLLEKMDITGGSCIHFDEDRGVPEVWGSRYNIRELLKACYYAIDKKKIKDADLNFMERTILKTVLQKLEHTDIEKLLHESGLI